MKKDGLSLLKSFSSLDLSGVSGAVINSIDGVLAIRDRIYLEKIRKFWIAPEEKKMEIDDFVRKTKKQKDWQKVGNDFLLVIESFASFDKCYYYGKIWIAWLEHKINTNELVEMTSMLQIMFTKDLNCIIYESDDLYTNRDRLYNCGFLTRNLDFDFDPDPNPKDLEIYKSDSERRQEQIARYLYDEFYVESFIGNKLKEILK